jgi:CheY-like chemotaxis protein
VKYTLVHDHLTGGIFYGIGPSLRSGGGEMMNDPAKVSSHRLMEILLLESNPADVSRFREAIGAMPFANQITVATSGIVALDVLLQRGRYTASPRPDVVVMDPNVTLLNGYEVLNVMMTGPRLRSIPVVVWSSSSEPEDVRRAYALGASAYVKKPGLERLESMLEGFAEHWFEQAGHCQAAYSARRAS